MGSSWNGFLPQNDIVILQWEVLEACQTEATAKALGLLVASRALTEPAEPEGEAEEDLWQAPQVGLRQPKPK